VNVAERDLVSLGADVGGKDAHAATHQHILALRQLLRARCVGPYGGSIKEFALVLRVDGAVQAWGKSGVENLAFQQRNTCATADVFVPADVWAGGDGGQIRRFLATEVKNAMTRIVGLAKEKSADFDSRKLIRDVESAIESFLN
jgi:hypothetical protein